MNSARTKGAATEGPPDNNSLVINLENVPQTKLHQAAGFGFTERRLRRGKVSESRRRRTAENKGIRVQTGSIESGQPLRVGDVEDFPTEG